MAVLDETASRADVDAIALAGDHPTKLPPPVPSVAHSPSHTDEQQPQNVETLHLGEGDVNVRTKIRTLAIVLALYVVLFIAALDQTIIATTIPTITSDLRSASGYIWIGGAYLLAKAAAGPIWTKGSDIWGRKPALLITVFLFAIASIIAALSSSMRMLIAARALQGVAAGGLFQLVQVTISDLFSVRKRALYFGGAGAIWAVAGTVGPLLGGVFAEKLTWRWCFWINLPICGVSFALLLLLLDVHNPRTGMRDGLQAIDWFGTASMLAVTVLLLLGLNFGGGAFPWNSTQVICLIVVGTCMMAVFVFSEKRLAKYPLMPLDVFKTISNSATFIVAFGHNMVSIGAEFYLPLYFQSVKQASPLRSGLLLLPLTIAAASVDIVAGIVINRTGRYRELIWTGALLTTLGTGLYIKLWTDTPLAEIIIFEIIGGAGVAISFQGPLIAIHSNVKQADAASATATLGFLNNLATSLSVVLGGVVFQNSMTARRPALVAAELDERVLDALAGDKAAANVNIVQTLMDVDQRRVVQDAFAGSVRNIFIVYTCIAAVTVLASIFIKQKRMGTEHTETRTGIANLSKREEIDKPLCTSDASAA